MKLLMYLWYFYLIHGASRDNDNFYYCFWCNQHYEDFAVVYEVIKEDEIAGVMQILSNNKFTHDCMHVIQIMLHKNEACGAFSLMILSAVVDMNSNWVEIGDL